MPDEIKKSEVELLTDEQKQLGARLEQLKQSQGQITVRLIELNVLIKYINEHDNTAK